jgi:fatty-acyl-CoA synthase
MLKYWDNPEATNQVLDNARWMHTGDLAMMDEEGYIHISGRIKDLIIERWRKYFAKKSKISYINIQNVLDAQVIGVRSEKFGEEVMAWIKVRDGKSILEEDLTAFAKTNCTL